MEDREAQLAWERRFGRPAAAAAFGAIALAIVAQVVSASAYGSAAGQRAQLTKYHAHAGEAMAGGILQALSIFLVAAVALYLLRCVRHRRAEGIPTVIEPLLMIAPVLVLVSTVITQLDYADIADKFVASGAATEKRADALLEDRNSLPFFLTIAGQVGLGFGLVMSNLNAMRLGLVTRFMGIIGIAVGALNALPILGPAVIPIQLFWLGAMGAIFLGRWPGGRGEAWETGEPGIWLSAAEQRRQQMRAEQLEAEPGPGGESHEPAEDLDARPHPVSKKRRRKRKR